MCLKLVFPLMILIAAIAGAHAELVDCIAVTISKEAILCSEVKQAQLDFKLTSYDEARERLIVQYLLDAELTKLSQAVSDADIDAAIKQYTGGRFDQQGLETALRAQGMTLNRYRIQIKEQLQKLRIIQYKLKGQAQVTEDEVRQAHRQKYGSAESFDIELEQLLFPLQPGATAQEVARVRTLAVASKLKIERGENSASLAKQLHDQAQASFKHIEKISRSDILPEFAEEVFSAREQSVLGPLRSHLGWNIIKVIKRMPVEVIPIEKVQKDLHSELAEKKIENSFRNLVEGLRTNIYISVHNHFVEKQ